MAVAQGAGLLDIQPLLETACMEEMTARCDHSRFHVLEQEERYLNKCLLSKIFAANPKSSSSNTSFPQIPHRKFVDFRIKLILDYSDNPPAFRDPFIPTTQDPLAKQLKKKK